MPPTPHNFILFVLDEVKFPLLRLLQFLRDLKSTIICSNRKARILTLLLHLLIQIPVQVQTRSLPVIVIVGMSPQVRVHNCYRNWSLLVELKIYQLTGAFFFIDEKDPLNLYSSINLFKGIM